MPNSTERKRQIDRQPGIQRDIKKERGREEKT